MKEILISVAIAGAAFLGIGVSMFYIGIGATVIAMMFIVAVPVCILGVHNIIYGPSE